MSRTKEKGTENKPQKAEFLPPWMLLLHFLEKKALCCVLAQGKEVIEEQSLRLWKKNCTVSIIVQYPLTLCQNMARAVGGAVCRAAFSLPFFILLVK